jgi:hypothetical protein
MQDRVIERRQKQLRDQIVRKFAAAAVTHDDSIALVYRRRADCAFDGYKFIIHHSAFIIC